VLLGLRILPGHTLAGDNVVCLSAHRRGIFRHSLHSRARPFAPPTRSAAARLIGCGVGSSAAADEEKEIQQEDSMKYLLMIVAALALVGTANATSRSADCCGGACCLVKSSCCAK
jgi:hypothetical protein